MRLKLLLAGATAPLLLWLILPVLSAGAPSASRVASLQDKIDSASRRIERKRGTEHVLTSDITAYTSRIGALQARIDAYDARIASLQTDLDSKRALLSEIQSDLRLQRARIVRLRGRLAEGRQLLAQRLRELYEADRPDLVTVVLNAKGFAQLLERMEFLHRISAQDRRIVTLVKAAKADATGAATRLAVAERRQRNLTAVVLRRRNQLASARNDVADARTGLDAVRSRKQRSLSSIRVSRQHLESEVAGLRREQARIQRALQAAAAQASGLPAQPINGAGGGALIWPVNGPITSPFCERRAWEACHPGLDIGVPEGTPIRAAAAGRVVLMQPTASSGGYGNYTCLQHSTSMSTCYAHQQRFGTSMGANVTQGQVIGYVGNTGHSFGAHLHFEVRINGAVTNPLNYL